MLFKPFKIAAQFFKTASRFPNFDDPNLFPQIQQAPATTSEVRKIPDTFQRPNRLVNQNKIPTLVPYKYPMQT